MLNVDHLFGATHTVTRSITTVPDYWRETFFTAMQWSPPEDLIVAAGKSIDSINRLVNRSATYRRDPLVNGVRDHWAKPETFFETKVGDCEDFALAKLALLKELCGIDNVGLALVYDLVTRSDHAYAVVWSSPMGRLALDNRSDVVLQDSEIRDTRALRTLTYQTFYEHFYARGAAPNEKSAANT